MQTDQTPQLLTDAEVVKALWSAHIPAAYHKKTSSLKNLPEPQRNAIESWLPNARLDAELGKTLECRLDGIDGMDASCLLARALVLTGHSVFVLTLPRLASLLQNKHEPYSVEVLEELSERDYLFLLGSIGKGANPYPNPLSFEMDWFLRNWMMGNKALLLQGEGSLDLCDWWSDGLRSIFNSRKALTIEGTPMRLAKGSFATLSKKGGA
jgi:hypothetical protein